MFKIQINQLGNDLVVNLRRFNLELIRRIELREIFYYI